MSAVGPMSVFAQAGGQPSGTPRPRGTTAPTTTISPPSASLPSAQPPNEGGKAMKTVPCVGSGTEATGVHIYHHSDGIERLAPCPRCGWVLTPIGRRQLGKRT